MSERMRGAIFNMLGDLEGLSVLDAYAGSGALGFEAISRGAQHVTAIDVDKNAIDTIGKNAQDLGVENKVKITKANSGGWSDNNLHQEFDIVLLDPPYDQVRPQTLEKLANHTKPGGVVILSLPPKKEIALPANFQLLISKAYGDATTRVYRKTPDSGRL